MGDPWARLLETESAADLFARAAAMDLPTGVFFVDDAGLRRGDLVEIAGPSGSGKTELLQQVAASVLHPSPDFAPAALSPASPRDRPPSPTVLVIDVGGSWDVLRTLQILRGRALEERRAGPGTPSGAGSGPDGAAGGAPFDADAAAAERVRGLAVCVARSTAEVVGALATACDWIEEGWGEEGEGGEENGSRGEGGWGEESGSRGEGGGGEESGSRGEGGGGDSAGGQEDRSRAGAGSQTASSSSLPVEPCCPPPPCLVIVDDLFSYAPVDASVRGAPSGAGAGVGGAGGSGAGPGAWAGARGAEGASRSGAEPFPHVVPVRLDLHSLTSTIAGLIERILATKKAAVIVGRRTPDAPRRGSATRTPEGGAAADRRGDARLCGSGADAAGAALPSPFPPPATAWDSEPTLSTPPPLASFAPRPLAAPAHEAGPPGVGPPPLAYRRLEPRSLRLAFDPGRLDVRTAGWDGDGDERKCAFRVGARVTEA